MHTKEHLGGSSYSEAPRVSRSRSSARLQGNEAPRLIDPTIDRNPKNVDLYFGMVQHSRMVEAEYSKILKGVVGARRKYSLEFGAKRELGLPGWQSREVSGRMTAHEG
jgi:hypothetical protein